MRRVAAGEYQAASQVIRYGEGGMTPNVALPCGGVLDVLIEYLPAGEDSIAYLQRIAGALEGHHALIKRLTLPTPATASSKATSPAPRRSNAGSSRSPCTSRRRRAC